MFNKRICHALWAVIAGICSIAIPFALIIGSFRLAFHSENIGLPDFQRKLYESGSVLGSQLWFPVLSPSVRPADTHQVSIYTLDLRTGHETDSGLRIISSIGRLHWIRNTLYFATPTSIYRLADSSFDLLGDELPPGSFFISNPFMLGGSLSLVESDGADTNKLVSLKAETWEPVSQVDVRIDWVSDDDPLRPTPVGKPSTIPARTVPNRIDIRLTVLEGKEDLHLFLRQLKTRIAAFATWRHALSITETERPPFPIRLPWQRIGDADNREFWTRAVSDGNGFLFASSRSPQTGARKLIRQLSEQVRIEVIDIEDPRFPCDRFDTVLIGSPESGEAFVLKQNTWDSLAICRVSLDRILPPHAFVIGFAQTYLSRWNGLIVGIGCAWLLHVCLSLCMGKLLLTGIWGTTREIDSNAILVCKRRVIAFGIDLSLTIGPVVLLYIVFAGTLRFDALADALRMLEITVATIFRAEHLQPIHPSLLRAISRELIPHSTLFVRGIVIWCIAEGCRFAIETVYRTTIGGALVGSKLVALDGRPCSWWRWLVRNLLSIVDFPLLVTPLPGVLAAALNDGNQTLADRLVGTKACVIVR